MKPTSTIRAPPISGVSNVVPMQKIKTHGMKCQQATEPKFNRGCWFSGILRLTLTRMIYIHIYTLYYSIPSSKTPESTTRALTIYLLYIRKRVPDLHAHTYVYYRLVDT